MATTMDNSLQMKYNELLEKRIAQLEKVVNETSKATVEDSKEKEDSKEQDTNQLKTRYRNILRKYDRAAGEHKDEDVSAAALKKPNSKDIAYTFRRVYDPETGEKGAYSELDIEGEELIGILKTVLEKYPGVNFEGDLITMAAPFPPLVHNWSKLKKKLEEDTESQATKDLSSLMDRIESAPELEKYFKTRTPNINAKLVNYDTLWTWFAPKTRIVVKKFFNTPQILEVAISPIPYYTPIERTLHMWAFCWDWNGKAMVKVFYLFKIDRFRGSKSISELEYYPLEFDANKDDLIVKTKERSQKYVKYVSVKPGASQKFIYKGDAYGDTRKVSAVGDDIYDIEEGGQSKQYNDEDNSDKFVPTVVPIKGEFLCDAAAFLQHGIGSHGHVLGEMQEAWRENDPREPDGTPIKLDLQKALKDDTHQLFPPRLLGYATNEKVWGQFAVDFTEEAPAKDTKPFREVLQLDPKYKEMIEALVDSHEKIAATKNKKQSQVEDVVQGKGLGLVLLLHGPPGVGKTLTAETVAKLTGKPLFIVSVAEIGLNPSRAEQNLEKLFALASKWEAILLVDEADVFLETRGSTSSAGRNALVSVLLRVLEYYQGIIILTTNRIKSIDVAVISRIHLAIRYTDLTDEQMRKIFAYFLNQLEPDWIDDREDINTFIDDYGPQYGLNGRQIRNVVAGALASARHGAKHKKGNGKLTARHLKGVCEMTRQFEMQLKENTMAQRYNNEAK
ncbi:hypothetical protein HYFRA_00010999 [Hymenoscyphus fraxineus]|uniref:AAA+ ATPase domain-containing protein n=1 Tax=Hymenoscyphus fraxineus TaxID=746836 RepID=A0A9N9PUK7_9HELO|nr:hypothetical protein HYFRA_00010999 [Hymenoscyphus fraxineus]